MFGKPVSPDFREGGFTLSFEAGMLSKIHKRSASSPSSAMAAIRSVSLTPTCPYGEKPGTSLWRWQGLIEEGILRSRQKTPLPQNDR